MLLNAYLEYLHTEFQIQKLLQKQCQIQNPALFKVSVQLLAAVMVLTRQKDRSAEFLFDFSWTTLFYGLPSAGVLTGALQWYTRTGQQLPDSASRPEVIRNLSVFASSLEWTVRPGDGNYNLCMRASKTLARIIDEVLTPQNVGADQSVLDLTGFDGLPLNSAELFNLFDGIDVDWDVNGGDCQWSI